MNNLVGFLLARIAEDEQTARDADRISPSTWGESLARLETTLHMRPGRVAHITRHDPARVLAECEAKRQIVEHVRGWDAPQTRGPSRGHPRTDDYARGVQYGGNATLRLLAQPYSNHPDFDPAWALTGEA